MARDPDLLVVGAGPAGAAAAIDAARAGLTVTVVDRAAFPRDKTCGDGLTTEALRQLAQLGVDPDGTVAAPVAEAVLRSPAGRVVRLPLPTAADHARVVRRVDLDAALVTAARAAGADVREDAAVHGVKQAEDGVEVTLADGTVLRAPFVVAADGHYSTVRRLVRPDAPPARGEWSAFRQYHAHVADRRLWVLFERDLLPGYAWVFPLPGGRANVGFGMLRGAGVTGKVLARTWADLLTRPAVTDVLGPDAVPEGPHRAWPIPTRFDPDALVHGRVLFAGDAAAVVDPMTGEGIAQALVTGRRAVAAVARNGHDPRRVGTEYRTAVERELGRDLRFAAALQRIVAHPRGTEWALRAVDTSAWTRRNFARWMFEDYPRALLLTPSRWRRRPHPA